MSIGVSSACMYPQETEKAFLFLAENGVKKTEIFFNGLSELKDGLLMNL